MKFTREQVLHRLRSQIAEGRPVVGAGAGTGISAKFAEEGGADLIIIYNSGRFRMAGHGSLAGLLAYGDANAIVKEMGEREVLPVVHNLPVIAGVMGTDPMRRMEHLLAELDTLGFSGINNFPTVGLIDGRFRMELERTAMGFGKEVEMIRLAHERGFFTAVYVFNPDEAMAMARVDADVIIAHLGLTVGGTIGLADNDALSLEKAPGVVQQIGDAAKRVKSDVILPTFLRDVPQLDLWAHHQWSGSRWKLQLLRPPEHSSPSQSDVRLPSYFRRKNAFSNKCPVL
jgi:predicted TIM-barrel enzyme